MKTGIFFYPFSKNFLTFKTFTHFPPDFFTMSSLCKKFYQNLSCRCFASLQLGSIHLVTIVEFIQNRRRIWIYNVRSVNFIFCPPLAALWLDIYSTLKIKILIQMFKNYFKRYKNNEKQRNKYSGNMENMSIYGSVKGSGEVLNLSQSGQVLYVLKVCSKSVN